MRSKSLVEYGHSSGNFGLIKTFSAISFMVDDDRFVVEVVVVDNGRIIA